MRTSVEVEGVRCLVPNCWDKYTGEQRQAVYDMVHRLKGQHGDRLLSLHVDRLVPMGGRWRIDGGYATADSEKCWRCGKRRFRKDTMCVNCGANP